MIKEIYSEIANYKKPTKKGLFKSKLVNIPVYEERYKYTEESLNKLEKKLNVKLPNEIYDWFVLAGCGAISDSLLIGEKEYIYSFENAGILNGYVTFATDDLGNRYLFNPAGDDSIFYVCHDPLGYARISDTFSNFLIQLKQEDYNIETLTNKLDLIEIVQ